MALPLIAIGGYELALLGAAGVAALTAYYMPGGGRDQLSGALNSTSHGSGNTPAQQSQQAQQAAQGSTTAAAGGPNCNNCGPNQNDDSNDPNKVDHIFGDKQLQKHKLQGLLRSFGGDKQKAYQALQSATRNSFANSPGRFQGTVNVNGFNVTVRGANVNGVPRLSTAFIP